MIKFRRVCKPDGPVPTIRKARIGYLCAVEYHHSGWMTLRESHPTWRPRKKWAAKAALRWQSRHVNEDWETLYGNCMSMDGPPRNVTVDKVLVEDVDVINLDKAIKKARRELKRELKNGSQPAK